MKKQKEVWFCCSFLWGELVLSTKETESLLKGLLLQAFGTVLNDSTMCNKEKEKWKESAMLELLQIYDEKYVRWSRIQEVNYFVKQKENKLVGLAFNFLL